MSKKVLVLSSSLRQGSNSEMLADAFAQGAKDAGHDVEQITLQNKSLNFCKGCLACQKTMKCVIDDDAIEIAEKMKDADVLVFATPVYYYSVSGQLKTMLDRANPLYPSDYQFRDVYLLASAAEDEPSTVEGAQKAIQGWVDCFEKANFAKTIFGGGVGDPKEMEGHPALKQAYNRTFPNIVLAVMGTAKSLKFTREIQNTNLSVFWIFYIFQDCFKGLKNHLKLC